MNTPVSKVAVIGAGVVGLSTAIRLREQGLSATIFAENRTPNVTSDRAGAIFSPFRIEGHDEAIRWTRDSLTAFSALATERSAESGVSMGRMHEYFSPPLLAIRGGRL
ncbi:MAG: FAD-binding oxidoreductase [Planctomycetes bacterium]|nr:FAD-binding oxidoreductase [Planctomycetota bacterium]